MISNPNDIWRRHHISVEGKGEKTLVLAHGLGCDQRIWHKIVRLLTPNFRVVLFDYIGAGYSDCTRYDPVKYASLRGYASDLLSIVRSLGDAQVSLLSHSASGSIGALVEDMAPGTFEQMIMLNPSPRYLNDDDYVGGFQPEELDSLIQLMEENYFQWANIMASQALPSETRPDIAQRLIDNFNQSRPDIMLYFAKAVLYSDYRALYASLKRRVHVVMNQQDAIVPFEVGQYLEKTMQDCRLYTIEASGHYPQLTSPEETVACVKRVMANTLQVS